MKIRYKLLAGLLGIPIIFGVVTVFLIVTNRLVQRDTRRLVTFHAKLDMDGAKLSSTLITGEKAAEELIADKLRERLEPGEQEQAESNALKAAATIRNSQTQFNETLASITELTQSSLDESRDLGIPERIIEETEELESVASIGKEARNYNLVMEKFLTVVDTNIDEADEVLNQEVEQAYEQRLLPLVERYAAARDLEVKQQAFAIEQSVGKVSRLVAYSAIGASLLAILIALLLSRSFSEPLKKLAVAATEIGSGRLGSRIQIKSNDEIGLLARAFNQMADDLSQTTVSKDYVDGIIKSMGDSLVVASPAGIIRTVNAATCRILGYSEMELVGQPVRMLFAEGDEPPAQGDTLKNVERTYLGKDGRRVPVEVSTRLIDEGGASLAVQSVARDITDRKRADAARAKSEKLCRDLVESGQGLICTHDLHGKLLSVNPAGAGSLVDQVGLEFERIKCRLHEDLKPTGG